jgi:hypothetical protein
MTDQDLMDKFYGLTKPYISDAQRRRIAETIANLERVGKVSRFVAELVMPGKGQSKKLAAKSKPTKVTKKQAPKAKAAKKAKAKPASKKKAVAKKAKPKSRRK